MRLPPLCLGKVLPLSCPLLFLWPSNPTMRYLSPRFLEGYACSHGELCFWLSVATCLSSGAMGLVAVKAEQHWLCRSITACGATPGHGLPSPARAANSLSARFVCLHVPAVCFCPCSTAHRGGRSDSEMYFSGQQWLHRAILNWFAFYAWQQEKPVPTMLLLLIL